MIIDFITNPFVGKKNKNEKLGSLLHDCKDYNIFKIFDFQSN